MVDKPILALLVVLAVIAVGMIAANHFGSHRLDVKSCFDDVRGLKAGAAVRLAGVDIGTVRSVRAQPQNKSFPAEVEMILTTSYRPSSSQGRIQLGWRPQGCWAKPW